MILIFALCAAWTVLSLTVIAAALNEIRDEHVLIKVEDE